MHLKIKITCKRLIPFNLVVSQYLLYLGPILGQYYIKFLLAMNVILSNSYIPIFNTLNICQYLQKIFSQCKSNKTNIGILWKIFPMKRPYCPNILITVTIFRQSQKKKEVSVLGHFCVRMSVCMFRNIFMFTISQQPLNGLEGGPF